MDADFVEEVERAHREWAFVHGWAEIRWNAVWRRRIVEWVRKQQALGKVEPELAERRTTSQTCQPLFPCHHVATRLIGKRNR